MKNCKRIISIILGLALCLSLSIPAFAAGINESGGSASAVVSLSSTLDGSLGGTPAATALSVTVPTTLPVAVGLDGTVTTASNCQITNNSYGAVRVRSVSVAGANGWSLTAFGDKATLASEKVDSKKLGFSLSIGGGSSAATTSDNTATQTLIPEPVEGCFMSGSGNAAASKAAVSYDAIVTPVSAPVTDAAIADVLFVIEWDT